jgi:hypothetical protein
VPKAEGVALKFFFGDGLTWDDVFDWQEVQKTKRSGTIEILEQTEAVFCFAVLVYYDQTCFAEKF